MPPQSILPEASATAAPTAGAAGPKPLTLGDFLDMEAEKRGISRSLARAMIQQESGNKHQTREGVRTSVKGARGLMQLMPTTAAGIDPSRNPDDPFDNITLGLDYLKQQLDANNGDVRLALAAYNAGPGRVANGRVPDIAETRDYVTRILTNWQGGGVAAPQAAQASVQAATQGVQPNAPAPPPSTSTPTGAGPGGIPLASARNLVGVREGGIIPGAGPGRIQLAGRAIQQAGIDTAEAHNPLTFQGRVNLLAMGAGMAAGYATANPVVGTTARASVTVAAQTAARTGIAPWIIRVLGPPAAAGTAGGVAAAVENVLGTAPEGTSALTEGAYQGAMEGMGQALFWPIRRIGGALAAHRVGRQAADAMTTLRTETRAMATSALESVQERVKQATEAVKLLTRAQTKVATERAATGATTAARAAGSAGATRTAAAVDRIVKQELDTVAELSKMDAVYNDLLAQPPSRLGAGGVATETLQGPTRQALKLAGQRIGDAAAQGPALALRPIQEGFTEVAEQFRPAMLLGDTATAQVGSGATAAAVSARPAGGAASNYITIEQFRAMVSGAVDPTSRKLTDPAALPGILGAVQRLSGDTIPYDVAHSLKMILTGMVDYSETSKEVMQRITKGAARKLREQMAGFAPYDDATAAFQALVPLYRTGIGESLYKLAQESDGAVRIANSLTDDAAQAVVIRSLLLDQAAAGGNPALGQRAWDAVRDVYTYNKFLKGTTGDAVETLAERVQKYVTQEQEVASVIFHDVSGQKILTNLMTIGNAVKQAAEQMAERGAAAEVAMTAAGRADRAAARTAGRKAIDETKRLSKDLVASSVGKQASLETKGVDILRVAALGPANWFGAVSLLRLFKGAKSSDLLRWAAYSDRNTQRIVKGLLGTWGERGTAGLVRLADDAEETKLLLRDLAPILAAPPSTPPPVPQ